MTAPAIVLHQFRASHFNDKARWALDYKGLKHQRITLLPGPHQGAIRKLSGQTSTPVMVMDGKVVAGSAAIIDALENVCPKPSLYPADADQRSAALAIQERFDREVGPATRTVAFTVFVQELGYVAAVFGKEATPLQRGIYRMVLPLVRPIMAKTNGASDPETVKRAFDVTRRTLDWLAEEIKQRKYLVGDQFSVADLSAAALLSPIVRLDHPDMRPPEPVPEKMTALLAEWKDHPAVKWVQTMYRDHRPSRPN